jgi:hypothetical protein
MYILYSFGTFFQVLVSCAKKNLATLILNCPTRSGRALHSFLSSRNSFGATSQMQPATTLKRGVYMFYIFGVLFLLLKIVIGRDCVC